MSDKEERPCKIRKLESLETSQESAQQPPDFTLDDKNGDKPKDEETPEDVENDLSNFDVQESIPGNPPLSKSQLKKRRRDEAWQAQKELRKERRRDKRHEKQARKANARAELQEKISKGEIEAPVFSAQELARKKQRPNLLPVTLIIDCNFDELMTEKELISLGAQLTRCYSDNRHSKYRAHMVMSSWEGALRTRFETVLTNHHKSWKGVRFMEKDYVGAAGEMDGVMRSQNGGQMVGAFAHEKIKSVPTIKESDPAKENGAIPVAVGETPLSASEEIVIGEAKEPHPVDELLQEYAPAPEECKENPSAEQSSSTLESTNPTTSTAVDSERLPVAMAQNPKLKKPQSVTDSTTENSPPSSPSIVYLTSDSPHTLGRLSPHTSYIIGGIVDKNRHKGLCYKRAYQMGIPTAKLPIGEYMTMQSRSVLAVNHVVEIMLKWLETGDWGKAFLSVIPKRKEARLRSKGSGKMDGEGAGEESEDEDGLK